MTPAKRTDRATSRPAPAPMPAAAGESSPPRPSGRKPWKKKSVAETILAQLDKLREEVRQKEAAYQEAKQQLDQLESLRKVLEKTSAGTST